MSKITSALWIAPLFAAACLHPSNQQECTGSQARCNGVCVDLATDPNNCSGCGQSCGIGQSCRSGACSCPAPEIACGAACVDSQSDAVNCGSCGRQCAAAGGNCQDGVCGCQAGLTLCGNRCVDLDSDPENCHGCGNACAGGQVCAQGECQVACPADAGFSDCHNACVDTETNPADCGGCGKVCSTGQSCSGGICSCPSGQRACDGGCIDTQQNQQNCGACGTSCFSYQTCQLGACSGPDLFAACFHAGAVVAVDSQTGTFVDPTPILAPPPDGGTPFPAQGFQSLLVQGGHILWALDVFNDQIDLLDVSAWPPAVLGSVAVGAAGTDAAPNQILFCDGYVLVLNSTIDLIQAFDPTSHQLVNEVSVRAVDGGAQNPYLAACDGAHTLYLTDSVGNDVKAIDLARFRVLATLTIPAQDVAQLPDGGGLANPYPQAIAYVAQGESPKVLVALSNFDPSYDPVGPGTVLVTDPALSSVTSTIDPGAACQNPAELLPSPDGLQVLESCGGSYANPAPGVVVPIVTATLSPQSPIHLPIDSPGRMAFLKNGLVAISDSASARLAIFNPADGGIVQLVSPCPDAGPFEFIGDVAAAP